MGQNVFFAASGVPESKRKQLRAIVCVWFLECRPDLLPGQNVKQGSIVGDNPLGYPATPPKGGTP